jgi:sugar phosphate isomerase/epimerase
MISRRSFLTRSVGASVGCLIGAGCSPAANTAPKLQISLAQWSLHRALFAGDISAVDFPLVASERFGIRAVEYVNQFYRDSVGSTSAIEELRHRAEGNGVTSLLIMVDGEGEVGALANADRLKAVDNHLKWMEMAAILGCHSIRVNAGGPGNKDELAKRVVDGLQQLAAQAKEFSLNVLVENHGGYSSDGQWLSDVIRRVNLSNCGTLPDFGNFCIRQESPVNGQRVCAESYDRYTGVSELMPYAKAVSAKSYGFTADGSESTIDYARMLKIVSDSGYKGYIGIEFEGKDISEDEGILLTKALLHSLIESA